MSLADAVAAREGREWVLMLDRDGVINRRVEGDYVRSWDRFEFLPGALDGIAELSHWAPRLVIVTNQQGVGKGLIAPSALEDIHARLRAEVEAAGGRIDDVLVCPHLAGDDCPCRKPRIGLASDWLAAHPDVDAALSVMVGDSDSDMAFGRALADYTGGAFTVRIAPELDPDADHTERSLSDLAAAITATRREDSR